MHATHNLCVSAYCSAYAIFRVKNKKSDVFIIWRFYYRAILGVTLQSESVLHTRFWNTCALTRRLPERLPGQVTRRLPGQVTRRLPERLPGLLLFFLATIFAAGVKLSRIAQSLRNARLNYDVIETLIFLDL